MSTVVAALVALLQLPLQPPRVGFTRDTVRVGDPIGLIVQLDLSRTATLVAPDSLELFGEIENVAPRRLQVDTLADGTLRYRIAYPIAGWRPGRTNLPALAVTIRDAQTEHALTIPLPPLNIVSVLPADTAGVQPKPPRDVWGASRLWWPLLLLALLLLAALAVAVWWWRRRPTKPIAAPVIPALTPREWALQELDGLAAQKLIERGEYYRFYVLLSAVLRGYLDRVETGWSTDLTTRELADQLYGVRADAGVPIDILQRADLVKFARQRGSADQATRDLLAARTWVDSFVKPELWVAAA